MRRKKCVIVVLDSLGAGFQYDAHEYGDKGSNTLAHICEWWKGRLHLPNMQKMGLGNIGDFMGIEPSETPTAFFGKMEEKSAGKDTTVGHWEMAGIITKTPFPTYQKFPDDIIKNFLEITGFEGVLGNKVASGTEIIGELGPEHQKTGFPIVYTSADSVFQIATHEDVISPKRLYEICEKTRSFLVYPNNISRVIARPFTGEPGNYKRTKRRKDFSVPPPGKTILDYIKDSGFPVISIGKIYDIFLGKGISKAIHTKDNTDGIEKTISIIQEIKDGLIFTNLVDFDMVFGHRNDPEGYGKALEAFDKSLPAIVDKLKDGELLIITGDHGCDPTFPGTDHTRETPILIAYVKGNENGKSIGTRKSFSDIAETIMECFELPSLRIGESFAKELFKGKL